MFKIFKPRQTVECDFTGSRSDISIEGLRRTFREHLFYTQGQFPEGTTKNDLYMAFAYTVRDLLLHRWIKTIEQLSRGDIRIVSYLSAEFLLGPHLENNLINLGIYDDVRKAPVTSIPWQVLKSLPSDTVFDTSSGFLTRRFRMDGRRSGPTNGFGWATPGN
jgi:hypothetical protein